MGGHPPPRYERYGGATVTTARHTTELPLVMLPLEVVALLRLDEAVRKDGTIRHRAMADALRSLDYMNRTGALCRLPDCGRRYSRDAVLEYLNGARPGGAKK